MERKEALERFGVYVFAQTEQMWKKFWTERERIREILIEKLADHSLRFLRQEEEKKETDQKKRMGFLTISYLQSGVVDGSYTWYLELQDKNGVLDQTERSYEVSMKECFSFLEEFEQILKKEARRYLGNIQEADCEAIKLKAFRTLKTYLIFAGVKMYQKIRDRKEVRDLWKESIFRVTLGEYKGVCQLIGFEDQQEGIWQELEKKLFSGMEKKALSQLELTRRWYGEGIWEEKQVVYRNLMFSDFRKWQAYHVEFAFCNLMGVNFSEASIQDSSMIGCMLQDALLEGANLNGVLFLKAQFSPLILPEIKEQESKKSELIGEETEEEIRTATLEQPEEVERGILPASFRGAVLNRVNFTGAILNGCDFRGAKMKEVVFEEALLEGAIFDVEEIDRLALSEEQKKNIRCL